ncbi:hypothetical protein [uncultured Reyranella sp.]|uniref:hypothetical protein n=1 Tax=uncultured Reyranella sp. TaxID=735512 RepID=UPI00259C8841|nr:hypothetical protein [uncultured Reyranella sp.]
MAALVGACIGAGVMAMGLGLLLTLISGSFGWAAMNGAMMGLLQGSVLGFGLGGWLVLRSWKPAPRSAP